MDTIENFDVTELRISSDEIKEYDTGKPYPSYISQALLRSKGSLVLSIRGGGGSQSLELMEGCII